MTFSHYTRRIGWLTYLKQTVYVQQLGWTISIGLIVVSIQLFYLRLFPNRWLRNTVYGVGALTLAWIVAISLVVVFQCHPIPDFWNPKMKDDGKCIKRNQFYFTAGLTSTVAILAVLFLPLPIILKLKTTTVKKVGLAGSFVLGAFVGVASIVRLVTLFYIDHEDLTCRSFIPIPISQSKLLTYD